MVSSLLEVRETTVARVSMNHAETRLAMPEFGDKHWNLVVNTGKIGIAGCAYLVFYC